MIDKRPLQVQFFTNSCHPQGTYFRFHNLAIGLTRLGHDVTVYAADFNTKARPRTERRDGVRYDIVPETRLNRLFDVAAEPATIVRRSVRSYPPCDVAHLFQPFPSAAAGWARSRGRVRFYDWDDLWDGGLITGSARRWRDYWVRMIVPYLERKLPRLADHVTAISQFLADRAVAYGAQYVTLLHSGSWPVDPPDRLAARARLGLRRDAFYVGFMGRTITGLPWCLDAFSENLPRHPCLRLAVCGVPAGALDRLTSRSRDRVDNLGDLSPADATAFITSLDLAQLPLEDNLHNRSRLPQKFGDYLATGVPLLCSTVGECGRLIHRFPWAIPAGTTREKWLAAFREAVDRIAADASGLVAGPAELERFSELMSWQRISEDLATAYYSALSASAGTGRRAAPTGRTASASIASALARTRGVVRGTTATT